MDYPVSLRVQGADCLVVGGGPVALRKAKALARAGASLRVVSPDFTPGFRKLRARLLKRRFAARDVVGALLVISATDDAAVNRSVSDACRKRGIPVNVVDQPDLCTFTAMSLLRRGPVTVAVSTGGRFPGLAKAVRRELERLVPRSLGGIARALSGSRRALMKRLPPSGRRAAILHELAGKITFGIVRAR